MKASTSSGQRNSSMTFRARPTSTTSWPRWRPGWPRPESGIEPRRCTGWAWPVTTADGTGDVVAQAITRLAEATGLSCLGEATAAEARAEAQVRLDELGLQAQGLGHRVRPGGRRQRDPRRLV